MSADKNINRCAYPWQQMIIDLTGEVVPCCFWAGYGNSGKPLGNTNTQTIDEIWHGEEYHKLRAKNASGDLEGHPCGNCLAYRWGNGVFPSFSWPVGFVHQEGHCYLGQIPEAFIEKMKNSGQTTQLLEDDKQLAGGGALHEDIRAKGEGRYSIWNGWLYFSSSDNTDPVSSGRRYALLSGDHKAELGSLDIASKSGKNLLKAYEVYHQGITDIDAEPSMISLISTADCNIDCPSCSQNLVRYTKVQHRSQTVPAVLAKVPYLSDFIWHGGEPYLIKSFREFIDNFEVELNPNLTFGFTSNGIMITAAEAEKLKKFPRINASVSVDSFNQPTFENIRAGAKYDRVLKSVLNLIDMHDAPERVFSVGMIICKSNFHELADNLQYAIDHDIGLNLSPVVLYPLIERLDVFSDFQNQTKNWQSALDSARQLVENAKIEGRKAISRVDPSGMVNELQQIFDRAKSEYKDIVAINCQISDSFDCLKKMRFPAVIAYVESQPVAYFELQPGQQDYRLQLPGRVLWDANELRLEAVHSLMEPQSVLASTKITLEPDDQTLGLKAAWRHLLRKEGRTLFVDLPDFSDVSRERNINWANYGDPTPDGQFITDPKELDPIYVRMYGHELTNIGARMRFHHATVSGDQLAVTTKN